MDVYLDHNATSPLQPAAESAMARYGRDLFANPSGLYPAAERARAALEAAREQLAAALGAEPDEVVFTSGGTEALNLAILAALLPHPGAHVVTTAVEHAAVRRTVEYLVSLGWTATFVKPQRTGLVPAAAVAAACRPETKLLAVQAANNELGTLQPVAELADLARRGGVRLLVDGVQALGKMPLGSLLGADLVAYSAHKVGGPKGVGALVVRRGVELAPLLHGGGQERGRRSGTENVAGAVGFAVAAAEAVGRQATLTKRWGLLREELLALTDLVPDARINGHGTQTLANTVSVAFRGVEGVALTTWLGRRGVAVSPGAACHAGQRSEVLEALGLDDPAIRGTIRLSMGPDTNVLDLRAARDLIVEGVRELREQGGGDGSCPLARP